MKKAANDTQSLRGGAHGPYQKLFNVKMKMMRSAKRKILKS